MNSIPFSWNSDKAFKAVLAFGAVYFVLTTVYSLVHYQEKFIVDGYALVFYITNWQWFPPPAQREVVYLEQVLPVLFAMLGMKIKWVMIGYILNAYLFYFLLFLFTLLVLKDPFSSLFLVLLHYKGDPYNYFFFVEEILPGACLSVVFLSLFRNLQRFPNRLVAYGIGAVLLFFIVRSHPLAPVCVAGGMAVLFFAERHLFIENKKLIAVMAVLGVGLAALKLLFLNSYDASYAGQIKTPLDSLLQLLRPAYLTEILFYLFYLRKVFTAVFVVTLVYLIIREKYTLLLAVAAITGGVILLFNMGVSTEDFKAWHLGGTSLDRWSLPVRFVIFATFCYVVLPEIKDYLVFKTSAILAIVYFGLGFIQVTEAQEKSEAYIAQAHAIIQRCRQEGVTKAVINRNELDPYVPLHHNCYEDIMVISSFDNPDSTVQAVYVDEEHQLPVDSLKPYELLLNEKDRVYEIKELNRRYYRLDPAPYVNLDVFKK